MRLSGLGASLAQGVPLALSAAREPDSDETGRAGLVVHRYVVFLVGPPGRGIPLGEYLGPRPATLVVLAAAAVEPRLLAEAARRESWRAASGVVVELLVVRPEGPQSRRLRALGALRGRRGKGLMHEGPYPPAALPALR